MRNISYPEYIDRAQEIGLNKTRDINAFEKIELFENVAKVFNIESLELFIFDERLIMVDGNGAAITAKQYPIENCYEIDFIAVSHSVPYIERKRNAKKIADRFIEQSKQAGIDLLVLKPANANFNEVAEDIYNDHFELKGVLNSERPIFKDKNKTIKLLVSKYTENSRALEIAFKVNVILEMWNKAQNSV